MANDFKEKELGFCRSLTAKLRTEKNGIMYVRYPRSCESVLSGRHTSLYCTYRDCVFVFVFKMKTGPTLHKQKDYDSLYFSGLEPNLQYLTYAYIRKTTIYQLNILSIDHPEESTKERASEGQGGSADMLAGPGTRQCLEPGQMRLKEVPWGHC